MKTIIDLLKITHRAWGDTFMHGAPLGLEMVELAEDMICSGMY